MFSVSMVRLKYQSVYVTEAYISASRLQISSRYEGKDVSHGRRRYHVTIDQRLVSNRPAAGDKQGALKGIM